jgi:Domain of unknown function DUF29
MATPPDLYNQDFYSWAMTTAELMRQRKWDEIDWDAVIEEIEGLARRDKRELASRLELLVIHLLKWCAQPQGRQLGHSWRDTIHEQRSEIELVLEDSPSLRREVDALLSKRYRKARERALDQTGLPETALPRICPWNSVQILADDFWPETW